MSKNCTRFSVYVSDGDMIKWIRDRVDKGVYASSSHAFKRGIQKLMEADEDV